MGGKKKKILVITGTRAEYGLLKLTIKAIMASRQLSLCLVVTGMHTLAKYGRTIDLIKEDGVPISRVVPIGDNDDMLAALNKEIKGLKDACLKECPAAILVLGDRDESFAGAIVGGHLKIPVFHIHGGDVSGYLVDEYIRHAITKFSHLHFTASKKSYQRVVSLGEEPWRVFNVGAPGLEALRLERYLSKKTLAEDYGLAENKKWLLVVQHPTPLDKIGFNQQIIPTLKAAAAVEAEKIVLYPNNDSGGDLFINEMEKFRYKKNFHLYRNLERGVYLSLLKNCDVLLGNSSSGIIEAAFFKLPVVNIGNRQIGRECGPNVIHAAYNRKEIIKAVNLALSDNFQKRLARTANPYGAGRVSEKIVKIIEKNINQPELFYKKFTYA